MKCYETLQPDVENRLSINTTVFLAHILGIFALTSTPWPSNITSNSSRCVGVTKNDTTYNFSFIVLLPTMPSQGGPEKWFRCDGKVSSMLNVSGYTTLICNMYEQFKYKWL